MTEHSSFADAKPHFFGPASHKLFGWFHAPRQAVRSGVGVVFCSPWGREEISAHHSIRNWAQQMAAEGWPVLHFDYAGCGDSSGDEIAEDAWSLWQQSVHCAIEELQDLTGVQSVCLIGIRLGATLAALAASDRNDVSALIAVAPVVKGRTHVRELTVLQMAGATRQEAPSFNGQELFQSGGFVMSLPTRDALAAVDLTKLESLPAPRVLLIERNDMPVSDAWCKTLLTQGAEVEQLVLPGYVDMMADPHRVQVPQQMVGASMYWLAQMDGPSTFGLAHIEMGECTYQADIDVPGSKVLVQETAVQIPGTPMFGIVTEPAPSSGIPKSGQAVIWLNAGSSRHIGPSRFHVDLARHWATTGWTVLRLDLAGLGDSEPHAGQAVNMTYPMDAMQDVQAALTFMQQQVQGGPVHLVGLCAGAYHGLKAARDGMSVASVTMVNPLIFFNAEGLELGDDGLTPQKVHAAAAAYKQSLWSADKWVKLLSGKANVRVLAEVIAKRMGMRVAQHVRNLGRALGVQLKDDLGSELQRLTAGGMRPRFVFSAGDPGVALMAEQGGITVDRLRRQGLIEVHQIDRADHVFTDFHARLELLQLLDELMARASADSKGQSRS